MTDRRTRVEENRSSHVSGCLFCTDANVCQTQTNGEKFGRHRREGDEARGDMEGGRGRLKGDKRMEPEKDEVGAE